ncbi:follistatin-related protein 4-like [Corticium candelabrum]|uniref:follistatin-related protein 4-like n=1 Tax=Corticium candelabrum TaxID=121492 RepID=UPI002E25F408|nr:follistatin-related protein 4-like [Corticium candelabrum]
MVWEVHKALINLLVVFCNLNHIQGCSLVCLNGGSIVGLCDGCKCAPQWSGYDCSEPCGGNISSATGHITSPGFPMNYKNNDICHWIVHVPSTSTVVLSFIFFDTEKFSDHLRVYKGETTDSDLVGDYHGYGIPYEKIMERSFLVVFTSDGSVNRRGFYLYWNTYQGYIPKFLNAANGDHIHTIVVKGDKVSLKCDAVGMPEPKVVWKKHGFRVAGNDKSFVELSGNELIFLHVNETDTGWYTCEAGNYLGKIQRSYQLTVHVFPVLIQNPDSIHFEPFVEHTQQAAFWCHVYGIPKPDVNWRKNGVPIENTSTYFRKGSQWLIIRYVNLADLGNYSCYVNNSLGHVESDLATLSASNATGES